MSSVEHSNASGSAAQLPWSYIAQSFVSAYYHALATAADTLYNFYDEQASAVRTVFSGEEGSDAQKQQAEPEWSSTEPLTGQMAIHQVSQQIGECRVQADTVDYVPSLDNGVLIQVTGVMHLQREKSSSTSLRAFAQSFLLVSTAESSYAIRNDILRFLPYHEPASQQSPSTTTPAAAQTADASTETTGLKSPLMQAAKAPTQPERIKQQSPEPPTNAIKSPLVAPTPAPVQRDPSPAPAAVEQHSVEEQKNAEEVAAPAPQQKTPTPAEHKKEAEEVKQPEPSPAPAAQQPAKKSKPVAPAKPPSWAALLSKDSKAAANGDASAEESNAAEPTTNGKSVASTSGEGGKASGSPTAASGRPVNAQRRDSRIDRQDDLKVGQSKFGTGYRPTGFFGKPTLEQVQASVVINAVPDDITHGQLREVVEREIASVRNLHQPQGKKFIVVYFHSRPDTEKALTQSTVNVNGHTLKLTVNTYRPSLGGGGFQERRRDAAPEQSRRPFANEPDAEGFVTQSKKSTNSGRGALRGGLSFGSGRGGRGGAGFQAKPKQNGVVSESA